MALDTICFLKSFWRSLSEQLKRAKRVFNQKKKSSPVVLLVVYVPWVYDTWDAWLFTSCFMSAERSERLLFVPRLSTLENNDSWHYICIVQSWSHQHVWSGGLSSSSSPAPPIIGTDGRMATPHRLIVASIPIQQTTRHTANKELLAIGIEHIKAYT